MSLKKEVIAKIETPSSDKQGKLASVISFVWACPKCGEVRTYKESTSGSYNCVKCGLEFTLPKK